jgi:hypothetical protein
MTTTSTPEELGERIKQRLTQRGGVDLDELLADVAALVKLASVAPGWKLVPIEPTPEMVSRAVKECDGIGGGSCGERSAVDGDDMRSVWEAMLAASPKKESP